MTAWTPRPAQPYEPGNLAALKHGGYSEQLIAAKAAEVHELLLEMAPWLDQPAFAPAVARYLRAEARALLLHDAILAAADAGSITKAGARIIEAATAADRLAAQLGQALGLDPIGHARLRATAGSAQAVEQALLQQVEDKGRKVRALREAGSGGDGR